MARWRAVLATLAIGIGGLVLGPTAHAAEAPVLTASPDEVAFHTTETITLALTGCGGAGVPKIQVLRSIYDVVPWWSDLPVDETDPGVWEASAEAFSPGSDAVFRGICPSGTVTPPARIDVDWKEMFTVPFQPTYGPLQGVTGTDCETGDPSVQYRVGDRFWVVGTTTDERGDFLSTPPVIRGPQYIRIEGFCHGAFAYGPIGWHTSPGVKIPDAMQIWASTGEGPAGTPYSFDVPCAVDPELVATQQDGGPVPAFESEEQGPGHWRISGVAGGSDTRVAITCGPHQKDVVRFDADVPTLSFAGPDVVEGTDCPEATDPEVRFTVDGEVRRATATSDLSGDWAAPVPAVPAEADLVVEASCGSVAYEPLTRAGAPGPVGPAVLPAAGPAAVPAGAVPGAPTFTG